jgi:hypothetical protein
VSLADGRNVAIEYRWADGSNERTAEFATEFVRRKVDVIVTGGAPAVLAAKQATSVIPIVFQVVNDPVSIGLVESLARPGAELLVAFPDWHVTVEDMFGQDNKVVTRWSLRATHLAPYHDIPATGLKIHAEGIHIDHIVGDKIAKRWACNNFTDVFNRLRAHAGK